MKLQSLEMHESVRGHLHATHLIHLSVSLRYWHTLLRCTFIHNRLPASTFLSGSLIISAISDHFPLVLVSIQFNFCGV